MLRYLYCSHFHYKVEKFRFISDTMKYRGIRMCTVADEPSYRIYQNDVIKLENDKFEFYGQ